MNLVDVTEVPEPALPLDAFKEHLRLGSGFTDDGLQDALLAGFLRAAMAAVEARTDKILIEHEMALTLTRWRDGAAQVLPIAPVSAITGVVVIDSADQEIPVAPERYRLILDGHRPVLEPRGGLLPAIPVGGAVRIGMLTGFGPDWTDVPGDLAQAALLLAAHYYEFRSETDLGAGCMPFGVTVLMERYRTYRLGGGAAT